MAYDLIGKRLGQFELRRLIGAGGMATVYEGYQSSVGRRVAIKVLSPALTSQPHYLERFEREVALLARLEHPHIVPIYDFGTQGGVTYIAIRLLTGGNLVELLEKGTLPNERALRILDQVGSALDYAHTQHVVHRDVKPANILMDEAGNAFLSDFGIASLSTSATLDSEGAQVIGTPAYMSPEQWRGELVSAQTDIYALGVIAYQMFTGRLPFSGETPLSLMRGHVFETPPQPPEMPKPVYDSLVKALAKTPDHRYPSASVFVGVLRAAGTQTARREEEIVGRQAPTVQPSAPATEAPAPKPNRLKEVLSGLFGRKGEATAGESGDEAARAAHPAFPQPKPTDTMTAPAVRPPLPAEEQPAPPPPQAVEPRPAPLSPTSAPSVLFLTLDAGVMVGQYRLERRLDRGERSRVYHAHDTQRGRDVAFKAINALSATNERATRFTREAQLLGSLHHAHIVPFYDYGTAGDVNYIVMPLLRGGTLLERMDRPIDTRAAAALVRQLAGALDYVHEQGVIHRDLKPGNILFGDANNAYIADFGLAKMVDDAQSAALTAVGALIGTPLYMSPELWAGERLTGASDQYTLGVILFHLLTGQPPFEADTPFTLMLKHMRENASPPSSLRGGLSRAVDDALLRALAKAPADRYPTVSAFAEALETALTGESAARKGHVFISYDRADGDYALRLADAIQGRGFEVWIDSRIEPSDSWWHKIVEAIEGCAAFVVVMTPDSEDSRWVHREVLLADQKAKPAFPLLLRGEAFPIYVGTQYTDVSDGQLPADTFFTRLGHTLGQKKPAS